MENTIVTLSGVSEAELLELATEGVMNGSDLSLVTFEDLTEVFSAST